MVGDQGCRLGAVLVFTARRKNKKKPARKNKKTGSARNTGRQPCIDTFFRKGDIYTVSRYSYYIAL